MHAALTTILHLSIPGKFYPSILLPNPLTSSLLLSIVILQTLQNLTVAIHFDLVRFEPKEFWNDKIVKMAAREVTSD